MIRLAWIVLAAVTLYGCASSPDRQSPESFRVVGGAGLPIHGNFCGPNIPATRGRTEAEQLRELGGIAPQDDIDAQCKAHDMCYVRQPSRKVECDLALIDGVGALLERKRKTKREEEFDCDAVALSIIGYFQTANPAAVKNWADKFVGNAMFQAAWGYTSVGLRVYQVIYVPLVTVLSYPVMALLGGFDEANEATGKLWKNTWGGYADRWQVCNF